MAQIIRARREGKEKGKEEIYRDISRGGIKTFYLCCVFAPGKEFFKDNIDYFAEKAAWVNASSDAEAIKSYCDSTYKANAPERRYVRVLGRVSLEPSTIENPIDMARETMQEYYMLQQYMVM